MTPQQALAFLQALNGIAPFVPPVMMTCVLATDVARTLQAIAAGQATCVVTAAAQASTEGS